jgi:serpin B
MPINEELNTYIENVSAKDISTLINNLKDVKLTNFKDGVVTKITGYIPLFKFDYELDFMNDLKKLGIVDVFDDENANLSSMVKKFAYISAAAHKANIEFSNEGVKAAAVTGFGGMGNAACEFEYNFDVPVEEIDLTFDNPYLFLIRDKNTGEVWFTGTVYEPISK